MKSRALKRDFHGLPQRSQDYIEHLRTTPGNRDKLSYHINAMYTKDKNGKCVLKDNAPIWTESHKYEEMAWQKHKKDGRPTSLLFLRAGFDFYPNQIPALLLRIQMHMHTQTPRPKLVSNIHSSPPLTSKKNKQKLLFVRVLPIVLFEIDTMQYFCCGVPVF